LRFHNIDKNIGVNTLTARISKLFGMDIYSDGAEYKGKVFDLVINLEKGRIETITTEPLRVKSKMEAKKIISEKSIPYRSVRAVKDIILTSPAKLMATEEEEIQEPTRATPSYRYSRRR
jgi:sporulation protein YlmC with PRC-barrel domain